MNYPPRGKTAVGRVVQSKQEPASRTLPNELRGRAEAGRAPVPNELRETEDESWSCSATE